MPEYELGYTNYKQPAGSTGGATGASVLGKRNFQSWQAAAPTSIEKRQRLTSDVSSVEDLDALFSDLQDDSTEATEDALVE